MLVCIQLSIYNGHLIINAEDLVIVSKHDTIMLPSRTVVSPAVGACLDQECSLHEIVEYQPSTALLHHFNLL